jgi:hypothetical protein
LLAYSSEEFTGKWFACDRWTDLAVNETEANIIEVELSEHSLNHVLEQTSCFADGTYNAPAIVIINLSHPHWAQLTNNESILNFIRHCTYDGVAESKAFFVRGKIEPDTVKLIKDNLLRVPLSLDSASS